MYMQNKYYTYMHIYENKILTIGVGTYYINRKTHKQKYERAYQRSNRGYQKKVSITKMLRYIYSVTLIQRKKLKCMKPIYTKRLKKVEI